MPQKIRTSAGSKQRRRLVHACSSSNRYNSELGLRSCHKPTNQWRSSRIFSISSRYSRLPGCSSGEKRAIQTDY
ncbi:uncharacterized protein HMPREF1541_05266 [Cyphellophora europaea CBS 101466]|uniref:Uncharacterized protein n=1 Tax=Cyphellophora europaea (strain CBS 101466) TaxID=1220924 RepID=W2RTK8_CYPE1|nr:uncharacterized protein HMPREF1541_05266 [Cyphellophora europaea CBS 101466]ETN39044.1 hypothetical protein HMPREF1541_05266 [Cyphellophora europaea CBS 101466]